MKDQDLNFSREAFLLPYNLAFLLVALVAAFAMGGVTFASNVILLLTASAELTYLGIMPRHPRFQRLIRSQKAAELAKGPSQREVFNGLSRQAQRRYGRLRQLEKEIQTNYERLTMGSQGLVQSHVRKLDVLLTSFLNLLYMRERYDEAMQATTQSEITAQIAALKADMEDDAERVRAVKERRLRILENRLGRVGKGRENTEIIEAQLDTIEDVTRYVHEQSLTLRNPEDVTLQLDMLLSEVEHTEASVKQIEDVLSGNFSMLDLEGLQEAPSPEANPTGTRSRT